jgi:preprotein translocase subunit SecA
MNDQRKVIFEQRVEWMRDEAVNEIVADMRHAAIEDLVGKHVPENAYPEQWDTEGLAAAVTGVLNLDLPIAAWAREEGIADAELRTRITNAADEAAAARAARFGPDIMRQIEKAVLLQTLDHLWREHLSTLDHLRQVIGLRGYGQRDPLNEYKSEAFELFQGMLARLREAITAQMMRVELVEGPPPLAADLPPMEGHHFDPLSGEDDFALADASMSLAAAGNGRAAQAEIDPNNPGTWGKVQRNATCPCGSGKKYKHCHGRFAS